MKQKIKFYSHFIRFHFKESYNHFKVGIGSFETIYYYLHIVFSDLKRKKKRFLRMRCDTQ